MKARARNVRRIVEGRWRDQTKVKSTWKRQGDEAGEMRRKQRSEERNRGRKFWHSRRGESGERRRSKPEERYNKKTKDGRA